MCEICRQIGLYPNFKSPKVYLQCVEELMRLVQTNALQIEAATCALGEVKLAGGPWYADVIQHKLRCRKCGQHFICHVDTYHGLGRFEVL